MAIYVITGKPRHGKTFFLVKLIVGWLKNGERVYSNILITPAIEKLIKGFNLKKATGDLDSPKDLANPKKQLFYWRNIREWNKMKQGIIVADEGTRYFNPRKWAMLSEETEIKLQQHGKEELDIWTTTQHFTRLDLTMRVLVERFLLVEKIIGPTGNTKKAWGVCRVTEHYLEDMERYLNAPEEDKDLYTVNKEYMLLRKKYAVCYDTRQAVGRSIPMDLVHEERKCKKCGKVHISHS